MGTGYGGSTPSYRIPYITVGDVPSQAAEQAAALTIENQLKGLIAAHSDGHGVMKVGTFSSSFATNNSTVTINPADGIALEAFIDKIYVRALSSIQWTGLPDNSILYLYAQIVETNTESSRVRGDVVLGFNDTGVIPEDAVLVAKATTTAASITVDEDPPERTNLQTVAAHAADNVNPHGTLLVQDEISASGINVLGNLNANTLGIHGDILVSGTTTFNDGLEAFGEAAFNGMVTVSGVTYLLGDTIISGTASVFGMASFQNVIATSGIESFGDLGVHGNINMQSGSLVDGRDISADGVRLDNHIADVTTNPHNITIEQLSGISMFGGISLKGNLPVESGVAVDGVDLSETSFLMDGSNADPTYVGTTLEQPGHTHNMSGIALNVISLGPEYYGTVTSGPGYGFLDVLRKPDGGGNDVNAYRWRADPFGVTSGIRNGIALYTQIGVPSDMDWLSGIELDIYTPGNDPQSFIDVSLIAPDGSTYNLQQNEGLQESAALNTKEIQIISPEGNPLTAGDMFTVLTEIYTTSGLDVYVGGLKLHYRTNFPGVM